MKIEKKYIYLLIGAVLIIGSYFLGSAGIKLGGADIVNPMNPIFTNGFRVGVGMTQIIDKDGVVTLAGATSHTGTLTLGANGTALNLIGFKTATWNPGAVTSSTNASTIVLTPYATVGDSIVASFNSATSTDRWFVYGNVTAGSGTAAASTTVYMSLTTSSSTESLDLSTSTVRLLFIR